MVGLLGIWVVYNASSILCLSLEHTHTQTLLLNSVFAFASVSAFLVLYGGFLLTAVLKNGNGSCNNHEFATHRPCLTTLVLEFLLHVLQLYIFLKTSLAIYALNKRQDDRSRFGRLGL
ncbi:hypothetical protein OWV82_011175, partial [Melia azedarach]